MTLRAEFQQTIVAAMGCDPALLGTAGVSVAGHPARAQNHVTAGYAVDGHFFITCDPAVEELLREHTAGMAPTLEAWVSTAQSLEGELLGTSFMHVPGNNGLTFNAPIPDGYVLRPLNLVADRSLIEQFFERNTAQDLDEADTEVDDLDEMVDVILDAQGRIASWASSAPFDMAEHHGDIAVITHPGDRGCGLGRAVVVSACKRMAQADLVPLYRCDVKNTGSTALCRSLGFELAAELTAFNFHTT